MNILWVKSGPLFPLNTGGLRRTHSMLHELARSHEVTYMALLPVGKRLAEGEFEAPYAKEKIWIPAHEPSKNTVSFYFALAWNLLFSTAPYILDRYRNHELAEKLIELDESEAFDVIICDFLTPAINFDQGRIKTPTILFQHNVEAQIWKRLAEEQSNPITRLYFRDQYRRMWTFERLLSRGFDGVITVSPEDAELSTSDYGLSNVVGAVPTGVNTKFFTAPKSRTPETGLIGFLGSMDWMPNIECVNYFVAEIFPKILREHPSAKFRIIGRDPTPAVQRLATHYTNVEVTGTVDDVRPHLDACEVLVVPLRSGGGTRIKIFEAMAQGVPVVSTTVGAEGLPVIDGKTILIADETNDFAQKVCQILETSDKGEKMATRARNQLVDSHSWEAVADAFLELIIPTVKVSRSPETAKSKD
ncbi:MAG: glycosyltransferase [Verrucomicrobiales bacterium]|nr:glycosyltransferase [Verrucomicrobiales bacterium]